MVAQRLDAAFEVGRRVDVVMRRPLEQRPGLGELENAIEVRRCADVLVVAPVGHPRVAGGEGLGELGGLVGRRIVEDQDVEVAIGLRQHRVQHIGEHRPAIEDGYADR